MAGDALAASWNAPVRSLPGLRIPRIVVTTNETGKAPGNIFITPRAKLGQTTGPTILDNEGRVVWFHRISRKRTAIGLQAQRYRGNPVLTWGQRPPVGRSGGENIYRGSARSVYHVIVDQSYRTIARVRARGRGVVTDLHEFRITSRNTALVLGFRVVRKDLRRYGGPRRGFVIDNLVQEIDIRTGRLLLNWSSAKRLSPRGSHLPASAQTVWDAYHVNSISEDSDGNLLLTARHLSAIVKIDRRTGRVLWKLGPRVGDFRVDRAASFYYPHDAQRAPDGTITIFDNRSTFVDRSRGPSRGLRLNVDMRRKRVTLARAYPHPRGRVFATSQGNISTLPGGNAFVGWGSSPWFSEYAPDGRVVFAASLRSQLNQSYRAFKSEWVGRPQGAPALAATARAGRLTVYASWNGATAVQRWRVLGGPSAASLTPLATVPWANFETRISVPSTARFVRVEALDVGGNVIGRSGAVTPTG